MSPLPDASPLRPTRDAAAAALLCLGLAACRPVEPAPRDLEGLLHFLWEAQEADDARLAEGLENLHALLGEGPLEPPLDGSTAPLDVAQVALAGLAREVDPSRAAGLYIATGFDCTLDAAARIVSAVEQDALYDLFDAYERVLRGDRDAFLAREDDRLGWDATYAVSVPFAGPYTATLDGWARWVEGSDGPFLLTRSVLVEPATFEREGSVFDQDYRIELYYTPSPGRVRHVEALWRHMEAGAVDTDSETVRRLILNGLIDWDAQTAALCAGPLP